MFVFYYFLQMYPYHISDVLVKGLRVTPFRYYVEVLEDLLLNGIYLTLFHLLKIYSLQ